MSGWRLLMMNVEHEVHHRSEIDANARLQGWPVPEIFNRAWVTIQDLTPEQHARAAREIEHMERVWGTLLLNDPAYSPNLTLEREDFSFACPPRLYDFTRSSAGVTGQPVAE